jgi:hypothetical protein
VDDGDVYDETNEATIADFANVSANMGGGWAAIVS